ncbi:uncharacterized protein LOC122530845 isoform X1 [Frieseomelitta varia]|uniref:uncharacterized protein LOC122530845 isoform X1 n=1 Tax=Frieseomelitta varia TaxID=561572 RepID=UPI001CB68D54|nr:uncharacterized protein LOC122530845 isoform X1 [Frieseomelitta varia]
MEPEQRGRASRASSTSSLGREVRCGCQYYQSDSLLPERRALLGRPPSRTMQQPLAVRCSEHEYEPIAAPSPSPKPATAPVVRITDTDVVPVADSDDSIDDRTRLPPELTRAGDVILPLDGKIEDTAMEGRELVETGDTSEELETPQQLQERLEERFLNAATPGTESRTDGEVNTSQVDSLALEELPLRRGARGLPQRIKTQAGKLRTRLRNIQRPTFAFAERQKPEKARSTSSGRSDRSRSEKRPSRMDRIRSSLSERPRFSLPNRPRFSLPDKSKFHLPERPRFNFPEKAKFHLPEKAKFSIKKPNIRLPNALTRKKSPVHEQRSTDSTVGSKRNIFDFSTYPRMFDRKSKSRGEYATSTPKDSRAQSAESATFPRASKKADRWTQRFHRTSAFGEENQSNGETAAERFQPWQHPSMEEPRLSISEVGAITIPWEEGRKEEELQYMDYEQESPEISDRQPHPRSGASRTEEELYDRDREESNLRLYPTREEMYQEKDEKMDQEEWGPEDEIPREEFRPIPRSRSLEEVLRAREEGRYEESFAMMDPRRYGVHKTPSEEEEYEEEMDEDEDEEAEPSSAQSDREQQHSSTSSCDRRRRGVIEEIDSDEFFLREGGLSQGDMNLGKYLTSEIRDALRSEGNALADDEMVPIPPQRPTRRRSIRKQKEGSVESYDATPPVRPKRDPNRARRSESADEQFRERTRSDSRHRVVYQTEGEPAELPIEPLDDIVVVKPMRRKSKSLQHSQSQLSADSSRPPSPPPVVPTRRKRLRKEPERRNGEIAAICNGHTEWAGDSVPEKPLPLPPTMTTDQLGKQEIYRAEEIMATSEENIQKLATRLQDEGYMDQAPVPPKRRSRSRGTSVALDEDRTSHGAESLPEAGYVEEDIPRDDVDLGRELIDYAIIEKREKPPRPPPPRRKRDKFATTPRPIPPKRPQRAYSTLGPVRSKEPSILTDDTYDLTLQAAESTPYIEIDSDDGEHKDLRSSEVLSKMQGRPLPAPPRPPRSRKDRSTERSTHETQQEIAMETTIATQTDPLPDDMVIEEEVTQAKLIVAPSSSGSQIMISTERIPSPSITSTPPVPPLPMSQRLRKDEQPEPSYDTVSLKSPSPTREMEAFEDRHLSAPHLGEPIHSDGDAHLKSIRSALFSEEPVRISNLEVGDLRVDRLSVSQIDASKIVTSELDALVITASELKDIGGSMAESLSPSIIRELMAIRSHLEAVAASRIESQREESKTVERKTDIPVAERQSVERKPDEELIHRDADEEKPRNEDQKVVKKETEDISSTHTLSIAQVEDKESTHTLAISQIVPSDKDTPSTQTLLVVQGTEDKSLQILDTETPFSLSPDTTEELGMEESLVSSPSVVTTEESTKFRLFPDRLTETGSEPAVSTTDFKLPEPQESSTLDQKGKETLPEICERKTRKSRSRSPSPIGIPRTRQTASPVRSLPPVISVTPDTPDSVASHGSTSEIQPQRAVVSYISYADQSDRESQRESSQSPISSFPIGGTHLIAFPASQVPSQFLSLANPRPDTEPSITDSTRQLIRVLRLAGLKAMRHFVGYMSSMIGQESREKIREVELTLCALLLLVAGLLIFFFSNPRTVTHHHHWDYFNPPK